MPECPFEIVACARYAPGRVEVEWRDTPRPTTAEMEAYIARTWDEKLAAARTTGQLLFNGPLARLICAEEHGDRLALVVGPTDYRDFVGTNLFGQRFARSPGLDHFANPLGTTATVITHDGRIVYGRRSRRVAYHGGYLHTFGGALEPADRNAQGVFDVFASVRRELAEELHLAPEEIISMVGTGLARDHEIFQPELLLDVTTGCTCAELLQRFDAGEAEQEHEAIEDLENAPDEVVPFLRRAGRVAPVCYAAMMLHGLHEWGRDWYERSCGALFGELPHHLPYGTGASTHLQDG